MTVEIRSAAAADADALAPLLEELGYPASSADIAARLAGLRESESATLVATGSGGEMLGLIGVHRLPVLHASEPPCYITALVVASAARGRGIGRRLLAAAEEWARRAGSSRLVVTSAEHRAEAHAFYERAGFPYTGRRFARTLSPLLPEAPSVPLAPTASTAPTSERRDASVREPRDAAAPAASIEIVEEDVSALADHARIPIAFRVREVLDVEPADGGIGGLRLRARTLDAPWDKDYDAEPGNDPTAWPARFDMRRWGIVSARSGGTRVGGAIVAWDTDGLEMMDGRRDLAVLWDIRVAPPSRGMGIGGALFRAAERWAAARGAHWLKAETQNINVPACRLYARHGCTLGAVNRFAYPSLPDETQLLWYKALANPPDSPSV
ncbi:MAG TPA: GNAT family N-acetyltransferase [Gemmatimonadaceae bacterium]